MLVILILLGILAIQTAQLAFNLYPVIKRNFLPRRPRIRYPRNANPMNQRNNNTRRPRSRVTITTTPQ